MANKVTVIGFTGSGKTTYLTGMYICMSAGVKNFSLLAKDANMDLYLESLWDMLCDGKSPDPSNKMECYDFHIAHNYQPVCDFEWLDYPGGILANPNDQYREKLESDIAASDCLFVILDGKKFNIKASSEEKYIENMKEKLKNDRDITKETKMLSRLSAAGIKLPPIGIIVTKYDLIQYGNVVEEVIRQTYPAIFEGEERVVMMVPVSLGGIDKGNYPKPRNIEQPIAFAVMNILVKYLEAMRVQQGKNRQYLDEHRGFWSSLFNSGDIERALRNISELGVEIDKWSKDAFNLMELFPPQKKIYIGGNPRNLRDYYRDAFSE